MRPILPPPEAFPLERRWMAHDDAFEAAKDDASRTVCEILGVPYDEFAQSFWKTNAGREFRALLQRFGAHVLLNASRPRPATKPPEPKPATVPANGTVSPPTQKKVA